MSTTGVESTGRMPTIFLMGSGGDGIVTAGDLLARAATNAGFFCRLVKRFGPQIRGGESGVWLQMDVKPIRCPPECADILLAFSWNSLAQFASQLRIAPGAAVFQDEADAGYAPPGLLDTEGAPVAPLSLPLERIATELESPRARNIIAVGFLSGILEWPAKLVPDMLERKFAKRSPEVATSLIAAFHRGRSLAEDWPSPVPHMPSPPKPDGGRLLLTGNDAVSLGAMHAGVEFFAGYPITPASEIMTALAEHLPGRGGVMIQAEDEIASMCMVIGASFGGRKAMTSTSGPGLSLMVEALGFATQIETPCVVVNVQRGGPSTGMPTMTEQSDLQLAVYGAHGDAPRVVLAPEDVKTCFDTTVRAFYIAETFQTPVIVLSDQLIGQCEETLPGDVFEAPNAFRAVATRRVPTAPNATPYLRYRLDDDPVSPMAVPGTPDTCYRTSGITHNEAGNPSLNTEMNQRMHAKIERKLAGVLRNYVGFRREGPVDAPVVIVTWGSTAGAACAAAAAETTAGRPTAAIVVELLCPFPVEGLRAAMAPHRRVAVAELSFSGQFARLLRAQGIDLTNAVSINRGGGDPLTVGEITKHMRDVWL